MDRESEKRMLMCRLSDDELMDRGREQADTYKAYCRVEAEKKDANEDFKDRLDSARKEMARLSTICKSGYESRAVECRWIYDYDHNVKRCVRQDTGEVVEEMAIPSTERQTQLLS